MLIFQNFDKVTFGFGTELEGNNLKLERVKKSLMWEVVYNHFLDYNLLMHKKKVVATWCLHTLDYDMTEASFNRTKLTKDKLSSKPHKSFV
jgi:hypothetical protein